MEILLTGSIAFDYLMTFPGFFKEQILPERLERISLSFLVDSMSKQRGGVAPNIAYTMSLLGQKPRIMATVGEDFLDYREWLQTNGVDTSLIQVIPNTHTASFFATTDLSNAQIATFYPGAMQMASQQSLVSLTNKADLVVVSPNAPDAMTKFTDECRNHKIPYVFDPSQQILRLQGEELKRDMIGAQFLFVNDYEFCMISKKTGLTLNDILEFVSVVVVTRGKDGANVYTKDNEIFISAVPERSVVDPTGVGDAFRGGFLAGYAEGLDWECCGQLGSLAAVYCLEQKGTQNHRYTPREFVSRFRDHYNDEGKLGFLLDK